MAKHTVIVKHPGKEMEIVEFDGQYRCDLKKLICNDDDRLILDYVTLGQTEDRCFAMACDQDGLPKGLPLNFHLITQSGGHKFLSNIVGTAVFFSYRWEDVWEKEIWDFELLNLDQSQIDMTKDLLSEQRQQIILAASFKDMSIHHNEVVVTRCQPARLVDLSFYFAAYGCPDMSMKFCTQPDCTDEYEIKVKKAKGNQEVIVCTGANSAYEVTVSIPSIFGASLNYSQQEAAMTERMSKVQILKKSLASIKIPEIIYITEGDIEWFQQEIRGYEAVSHQNRRNYEAFIKTMYDFDPATQEKIQQVLKIAVSLYSSSKKRKYIEEHLCGLLTPEEIAKIPIEKWR